MGDNVMALCWMLQVWQPKLTDDSLLMYLRAAR